MYYFWGVVLELCKYIFRGQKLFWGDRLRVIVHLGKYVNCQAALCNIPEECEDLIYIAAEA